MAKLTSDELVDAFKEMTLAELPAFVRKFEQTFGVTADLPAIVLPEAVEVEEVEEQTEFDVILESAGEKKIGVIKVVRELAKELGLKQAKDLVDAAPTPVLRAVSKQNAEAAGAKLVAAGATVTVK